MWKVFKNFYMSIYYNTAYKPGLWRPDNITPYLKLFGTDVSDRDRWQRVVRGNGMFRTACLDRTPFNRWRLAIWNVSNTTCSIWHAQVRVLINMVRDAIWHRQQGLIIWRLAATRQQTNLQDLLGIRLLSRDSWQRVVWRPNISLSAWRLWQRLISQFRYRYTSYWPSNALAARLLCWANHLTEVACK